MKLLQRLDEKVVDGHPDRPAPVRVPSEQPAVRLRGFIGNALNAAVRGRESAHTDKFMIHQVEIQ